jgi:acyl-CoA thioesterase-1
MERVARAGRIVALGDSLTAGYGIGQAASFPAVLQRRLDEEGYEYIVVNGGVSGDTSARALERLPALLSDDVRIVILAIGVNDGLRGLPVTALRANLERMIAAAARPSTSVLLCGMEAPPIHGLEYTMAFHRVYEDLARTHGIPLVPFVMMHLLGNPALLLPDRIHPNGAGARAIADQIWPHLRRLLRRVG